MNIDYIEMRAFMESFELHTLALGWTNTTGSKQRIKLEKYWIASLQCHLFNNLLIGIVYTNLWTKIGFYTTEIGVIPALMLPNSSDFILDELKNYNFLNKRGERQIGDNLYNYSLSIYTESVSGHIATPPRQILSSYEDKLWLALFNIAVLFAKTYDDKEVFDYLQYGRAQNLYPNPESGMVTGHTQK